MGIPMSCPRCTLLLGLLAAALLPRQPDSTTGPAVVAGMRSVHASGLQLHYTRNVSEAEAERVAAWLAGDGVSRQFPGPMRFDHTDASCQLDLTAPASAPRDEALARRVRRIAEALSTAELKGARIQVCLRDLSGTVLVTIYPADEGPFIYNGAAPGVIGTASPRVLK